MPLWALQAQDKPTDWRQKPTHSSAASWAFCRRLLWHLSREDRKAYFKLAVLCWVCFSWVTATHPYPAAVRVSITVLSALQKTSSTWMRISPHHSSLSDTEQSQDKHRSLRAPHASMSGQLWAQLCLLFSGARMSTEQRELARNQPVTNQRLLGALLLAAALAVTKQLLHRQ